MDVTNTTNDEMNVEQPVMNDQQQVPNDNEEEEDIVDDTPEFVDMSAVVEVKVDDTDVPMDEDDDDDADVGNEQRQSPSMEQDSEPIIDMSKTKIESHTDSVYSVACHVENGQLSILSGGGDDKAFLHKVSSSSSSPSSPSVSVSSQQLAHNHTDTVSSVAFNLPFVSTDLKKTPRLAAVGSYDGAILLYDPDSGEQKLKLEGPSDVEWMCFHPKGGSVLLVGSGDGTVWMFHIPLNKCLQVFVGHEQAVSAGCFSPDGKWAVTASADGTCRIWAPKTGMNKHVFRLGEAGLTCMANGGGTDSMLIIVGAEDGQAHVCHIGTKKTLVSLRHFEIPTSTAQAGDDAAEMDYPMSVEAVGFSPSQPNWCATAGVDGKLKIWDLTKDGGLCRHVCKVPQQQQQQGESGQGEEQEGIDSITRLQWHPTLPIVFTSTIGGVVRVWDARSGNLLHTVTGHTEMINDMDIFFLNETGSAVIVSAGDDKTVRVFEVDVNAIFQTVAT